MLKVTENHSKLRTPPLCPGEQQGSRASFPRDSPGSRVANCSPHRCRHCTGHGVGGRGCPRSPSEASSDHPELRLPASQVPPSPGGQQHGLTSQPRPWDLSKIGALSCLKALLGCSWKPPPPGTEAARVSRKMGMKVEGWPLAPRPSVPPSPRAGGAAVM